MNCDGITKVESGGESALGLCFVNGVLESLLDICR